eukprot:ANDGO_07269.mRNA.1 hypothetical protein
MKRPFATLTLLVLAVILIEYACSAENGCPSIEDLLDQDKVEFQFISANEIAVSLEEEDYDTVSPKVSTGVSLIPGFENYYLGNSRVNINGVAMAAVSGVSINAIPAHARFQATSTATRSYKRLPPRPTSMGLLHADWNRSSSGIRSTANKFRFQSAGLQTFFDSMLPLMRAHVRSVHRQIIDQVIPSIAAYAPSESFPHVTFSSTANSVSGVLNLTLDVDTDQFTVPEAPRQHFSSYSVHLGLLSVIEYRASDCSGFNKTFSPDSCSGFQKYDVAYADWSPFAPHSVPSQYGFIPYVSTIDIPSKGTLSVTYISSPVKAQFQNITLEDDTVYLFVNITSWTYSSGNELLAFEMVMVGEFVSGSAIVNQTQLTSIYNSTGSTRPAAKEFFHFDNVISSSQGTASFLLQPRPPSTNFSLFTLPTCAVPECSLWDANATKSLVYYSMVSPDQSDFTWVVTLDSATPVADAIPPPSVPPPRSPASSDENTLVFEILFALVAFAFIALLWYCWVLRRRLAAAMKNATSTVTVPLELQSSSEYRRFQEG